MIGTIFMAVFDFIVDYFLAIFGALFIVIMAFWFLRGRRYAPDIANFATTTGIFFTFLGIVMAVRSLGGLDESDIRTQLDKLLTGIYVAFVPSIFGAGVAVFTHIFPGLFPSPIDKDNDKDKPPISVDEKILKALQNLNGQFENFSQQIAEKIIQSLSESMDKLNEKLGEQFGENFAKFADAIPQLLEWQENYRRTIAEMQDKLNTQTAHLETLLTSLNASQEVFNGLATHIENVTENANTLTVKIDDIAVGLAQASNSITAIKNNAEQMEESSDRFATTMQTQIDHSAQQNRLIGQSAIAMQEIASAVDQTANNVKILGNMNKDLAALVKSLEDAMRTITGLRGGVDEFAATLPQKADEIKTNMQDITQQVMQELASNLRGISEALVNDYERVHQAIGEIANKKKRWPF